jgi:hypothetical protein
MRYCILVAIAFCVGGAMIISALRLIRRDPKLHPVLATYILFIVGSGLSLWTYFESPDPDAVTYGGVIIGACDCVLMVCLLLCLGWHKFGFDRTQKLCLGLCTAIAVFWAFTGRARESNWCIQLVMFIAYWPTYTRLWYAAETTELTSAWSLRTAGSALNLAMAIAAGDWLAIAYVGRSTLNGFGMLYLIRRVHQRAARLRSPVT